MTSSALLAALPAHPGALRRSVLSTIARSAGNRAVAQALVQRAPRDPGDGKSGGPAAYPGKLRTDKVVDRGGRHMRISEYSEKEGQHLREGEKPDLTEVFWVDFEVDEHGVMTASARTVTEDGAYRSPTLQLKPEMAKAEKEFTKAGVKVDEFEGDWSYMSATELSTNLQVFKEQRAGGATPEDAAKATPSGKAATAAGFTEVRIKSMTMEELEHIPDGKKYERVRVAFTRPISGPQGKPGQGPGEGGGKPAEPPPTTTTTTTRVTAGVTLLVLGANIALNGLIEMHNESRIRDALKDNEAEMLKEQKENPTLGFLLLFRYSGGRDSNNGPTASARFEKLGWQRGYTESETRNAWNSAAHMQAADTSYEFGWVEPLVKPSPDLLATPFQKAALAKFADISQITFQKVQFKAWGGFDTHGTDGPLNATKWHEKAEAFRFVVLRMPPKITIHSPSGALTTKEIDVSDTHVVGGDAPALMLDGDTPAITVWAADAETQELFDHTPGVNDKENKLDPVPDIDRIRWLPPEQVKIVSPL